MISTSIEKALNAQVLSEAFSSQLYLSMASWAETSGFNGIARFLYTHSDEERIHMLKLVKYINERGGHAIIPAVKAPPVKFESLPAVFEGLLRHEEKVSAEINELVSISQREKDFSTYNFLQWYVAEQIEEEALGHQLIDKLKLIGADKGGLYMFDRDITSIAAAAAAPGQGA